jgi:hypothetical protein
MQVMALHFRSTLSHILGVLMERVTRNMAKVVTTKRLKSLVCSDIEEVMQYSFVIASCKGYCTLHSVEYKYHPNCER